jgi:hypothetical protein
MTKTSGVPAISAAGREREAGFKRLPGLNAASLIRAMLLGGALSLTMATASFAQSYDPDVGSGNITGSPNGGARYFGGIHRGWHAMVIPHRTRHGRHHRARHR